MQKIYMDAQGNRYSKKEHPNKKDQRSPNKLCFTKQYEQKTK